MLGSTVGSCTGSGRRRRSGKAVVGRGVERLGGEAVDIAEETEVHDSQPEAGMHRRVRGTIRDT